MHIIFGQDRAEELKDRYMILELDTIRVEAEDSVSTAYCVIERIAIEDLPTADDTRKLHEKLMESYRAQDWDYCETALASLMGKWNGEVDSFYVELQNRIANFRKNPPGTDWNAILIR